jgi:hypothetical protein
LNQGNFRFESEGFFLLLISGAFWAGGVDAVGICAMQSAVPIENERKILNVRHIIVVSVDCIACR